MRTGTIPAEVIPRTEPSVPIPVVGPLDGGEQRIGLGGPQARGIERVGDLHRPVGEHPVALRGPRCGHEGDPVERGPEAEMAAPPAREPLQLEARGTARARLKGAGAGAPGFSEEAGALPALRLERSGRDNPEPRGGEALGKVAHRPVEQEADLIGARRVHREQVREQRAPPGVALPAARVGEHGRGVERCAVLEANAEAQREGPGAAIGRGVRAQGEPGLRGVLPIGPGELGDQRLIDLAGDSLGEPPLRGQGIERRGEARQCVGEGAATARRRQLRAAL